MREMQSENLQPSKLNLGYNFCSGTPVTSAHGGAAMVENDEQKKKQSKMRPGRRAGSAYITRVWEIVTEKAGFEPGDKTKRALLPRIDALAELGVFSYQAGPIIFHEWQEHRKFSRRLREMQGDSLPPKNFKPRQHPGIVVKKGGKSEEADQEFDDGFAADEPFLDDEK
jgi:hypothetical protein